MHSKTQDDKAPIFNISLNLEYSFDYTRFNEPSLESTAKATLGNFFGFVRQSFDGLLQVGHSLENFYLKCLSKCPDGKKVFEEWLKSDDFGSSRYIATSAMEIWAWFKKLPGKIQHLIRQNVQKWSVSALRQLTKVSNDLLKELVGTGKKTAQQVKSGGGSRKGGNVSSPSSAPLKNSRTPEQAPELFTAAQVQEKIAEALAQRDREKAEEEQARYIEVGDAARQAVKRELIAAEQYASSMAQAKQALLEQLAVKEQELQSVRALQIRNEQLEQRVTELEKALEGASANNWNNTFTTQAAKVINSDLEKTIAPLSSEVERLQNLVKCKEQELLELQTQNEKQQEELVILQQSSVQVSENILTEFGEIGEQLGWAGWSRRGYRAASGMLHTGINSITAFVADLSSQLTYQQEMAF
ncbi:hypothetical protein NIES2101_16385 [Calothrix sp. HK-06]|nr:hypothetical protein NIES2101_16385 [Calothrix sp. HK-06]